MADPLKLLGRLRVGPFRRITRGSLAALYVRSRWQARSLFNSGRRRHHLPGKLHLTLTSHAPRFKSLALTLKCLLLQQVKPDGIYLWIGEQDASKLPEDVLALRAFGLRIETCPDLRAYTKLIPAIRQEPGAFWVTVDDDCYYPSTLLTELIEAWEPESRAVVCRRAHRMTFDGQGRLQPYRAWVQEIEAGSTSELNFPTGVGGVLYPPGCFAETVTDQNRFKDLSPHNDDIWFWWMIRLNRWTVRKTHGRNSPVNWDGTQGDGLFHLNVAQNESDQQMRRMTAAFGSSLPPGPENRSQ